MAIGSLRCRGAKKPFKGHENVCNFRAPSMGRSRATVALFHLVVSFLRKDAVSAERGKSGNGPLVTNKTELAV